MSTSTSSFRYGGYNFDWSPAEKKHARRAFDRALQRELDELVAETKRRAKDITSAVDVWQLEEHLTERRKQIDAQYDFRCSVLPSVFADLIRAGRMHEQDLNGIGEDKLAEIRRLLKLRR